MVITMIDYLSKKFALTRNGSKELMKGMIYTALLNISIMIPVGLYVLVLYLWMEPLITGKSSEINLWIFIIAILIVLAVIFLFAWKQYHAVYNTTYRESEIRRVNLAESLRKLPLSFFENRDLSDLTTTIMGDCTDLEHTFSHAIPQLFGSILSVVIVAISLFSIDYRLSIALLWVVPVAFIIIYASKSLQQKGGKDVIAKTRACSDGIQECIETMIDLKSYNYEKKYLYTLDNKIKNVEKSRIKSELMGAAGVVTGHMFLKLGMLSVMLIGAYLIVGNSVSIFVFLLFLIASAMIYTPIENSLLFLSEIFNSEIKIKRMRNINDQVMKGGTTDYNLNSYDLKFSDVEFNYDSSDTVLKNINFTAKQGEVTALVGPSGCGKSTITKLAAKFWNPTKGKVELGGVNLYDVDSEKILENYAIVFQDVVLFNDTIKANIKIGSRDATDEEIKEVAKIARCDEFIEKLPDGYDTLIGENGALLSGGQRQRISIARALLKDAPIILLDEATSFLDVENESEIQKAISALIKNKTVIVIAHRMRTIANADKIIVLDKGTIIEEGSPNELLENNGLFAKMVNIQKESSNWNI